MRVPDPVYVAAAQASFKKYGILASVSLAQWAQESGWGEKVTGTFNYFGVKARPGDPFTICDTHEVVHGVSQACMAPFRNFSSVQEAFDYHAVLLATHKDYAAGWPVKSDYVKFIEAIGPHYATDPHYAAELITLIREEGFLRYD